MAEQEKNPYPVNVFTACYVGELDEDSVKDGPLGTEYQWRYQKYLYRTSDPAYPCDVLERKNTDFSTHQSVIGGQELYTAKVYHAAEEAWIVRNIPRRAIEFFDENYTSDLFNRNAFRHYIQLPDRMIPEAWKDIQQQ
jgi:hypothetical protein